MKKKNKHLIFTLSVLAIVMTIYFSFFHITETITTKAIYDSGISSSQSFYIIVFILIGIIIIAINKIYKILKERKIEIKNIKTLKKVKQEIKI